MITSFKLLLKNPTQVSPLHSCHLKYDLPVTVLVSGIWWWSCSYLTFRTPEFLFLMEPDGNYTFHHPSLAVVVWMYYSQTWHSRWKFGAWNWYSLQGKDLGTNHLPAKINRSDCWPENSLDWIALLSVRANSCLVIPEPQKTWCIQTIFSWTKTTHPSRNTHPWEWLEDSWYSSSTKEAAMNDLLTSYYI